MHNSICLAKENLLNNFRGIQIHIQTHMSLCSFGLILNCNQKQQSFVEMKMKVYFFSATLVIICSFHTDFLMATQRRHLRSDYGRMGVEEEKGERARWLGGRRSGKNANKNAYDSGPTRTQAVIVIIAMLPRSNLACTRTHSLSSLCSRFQSASLPFWPPLQGAPFSRSAFACEKVLWRFVYLFC